MDNLLRAFSTSWPASARTGWGNSSIHQFGFLSDHPKLGSPAGICSVIYNIYIYIICLRSSIWVYKRMYSAKTLLVLAFLLFHLLREYCWRFRTPHRRLGSHRAASEVRAEPRLPPLRRRPADGRALRRGAGWGRRLHGTPVSCTWVVVGTPARWWLKIKINCFCC